LWGRSAKAGGAQRSVAPEGLALSRADGGSNLDADRHVDEVSVATFRRGVGTLYPPPVKMAGKGDRWVKEKLDEAIDQLSGSAEVIRDIADEL